MNGEGGATLVGFAALAIARMACQFLFADLAAIDHFGEQRIDQCLLPRVRVPVNRGRGSNGQRPGATAAAVG